MEVMVGVSNHHVHVTQEDLEVLFGKGSELEVLRDLKQPGQFASNQIVSIKTDKTYQIIRELSLPNITYISIAKIEDEFMFIQRILQFGTDFNIISPDFFKEILINKIKLIQKGYKND